MVLEMVRLIMINIKCPICSVEQTKEISSKSLHSYFCPQCCHFFSFDPSIPLTTSSYYAQKNKRLNKKKGKTTSELNAVIPAKINRRLNWLEKINEKFSSYESFLDVGCGDGKFLSALKKRYKSPKFMGVDLSPYEIEHAKQSLSDVHFYCGVLEDDVVKKQAPFDCVTAFHVIEHVADPKAFLINVKSLLSVKGICVIACPIINARLVLTQPFPEFVSSPDKVLTCGHEHLHHFTSESLKRLCNEVGMKLEAKTTWVYKGRRKLEETVLILKPTSELSSVKKETFFLKSKILEWSTRIWAHAHSCYQNKANRKA